MKNTERNYRVLGNIENGYFVIPFERKTDFEEVTTSVDFEDLTPKQKLSITTLSTIVVDKDTSSFCNIFPEGNDNELCYLVSQRNRLFLVNNEGYQYSRYLVELTNY